MAQRTKSRKRAENVYAHRRRSLARRLAGENVDAMLLTRSFEVGYLTGYIGAGSLVVGRGWSVLVTDGIHAEQAEIACDGLDIHVGVLAKSVKQLLRGRAVKRVGVHGEHVTLVEWLRLQDALGARRLQMVGDLAGELRLVKDAQELRQIRKAVKAAEEGFRVLTRRGRKALVGRAERQVAMELDHLMRQAGADGSAFETIVAAGSGTSQPHYRPGNRRIRLGEPVLFDWGASVGGYLSDLTRVVFTGTIPPKIGQLYEVVRRAQAAAMKAIKPGVMAASVDRAARRVIDEAGYADLFIHGIGHGLGREVHEDPPVTANNVARLRVGMVITVEPGVYVPKLGGVRLEDDVVVTAGGRRKLSSLPVNINEMILR
ncbi:MAG: M24 family metallopeptidase [Planctomycetota bacterium]